MNTKATKETCYLRAKERVTELKEFYIHLSAYIIVNLFLSSTQVVDGFTEDKSFTEIFSDMGIYGVWLMWGIGICFHALKVFGSQTLIGKNWEERKIKELMNQNKSK